MLKVTLEQKYNHCVALNIELEEIIEMQNIQLMKKDEEILRLKVQNVNLHNELIEMDPRI